MDQETSKTNEEAQLLEKLQRDFEEHRKKNPSKSYPTTLKQAAIDALSQGIEPKALRTACQISIGQFNYWKQVLGKQTGAKVLKVIDGISEPKRVLSNEDKIEVHIGHWHLILQPNHTSLKD
jgi:hypothetical protein